MIFKKNSYKGMHIFLCTLKENDVQIYSENMSSYHIELPKYY